ncbi:carbohydrate-binding module family 43 protein/Glycoside hydrolase family 72 protein [Dentipellis sp. KUC8613]|nr:carbohydrate-binding module family 43 protein/Glycoside hydrolase family 72 protein [Dentipellis sp. KUC8613]
MFNLRPLVATLAVAAALSTGVQAIGKISRSGRYLYNADGSRFYIKGVAYQEQGTISTDPNNPFSEPTNFIDPLANDTACARDVPFLQQLGVNTIRAYSVNSSLNHDACMQALSNAGIYTIIDLTLPVNGSIDRAAPAWTTNLLDLYIGTINAFAKYDNVLAYNVGNEVVTAPNATAALTYVKAAARDTKAYLNSKSSNILVGYAAIDGDDSFLDPLANYLSCDASGQNSGGNAIDIFGLNNYEWCGNSTFEKSYAGKTADFANYNVVAYFSEFGCNNPSPRVWTEVAALFSSQMSPVWSGGLAFSYFPAESDQGEFGMVTISSDGTTVTTSTDFNNLKAQYGQASGPNSPSQSSAGSSSYPNCPASNSSLLVSTTLPPTPNDAACQCLQNNLSCQFTPKTSNTSAIVGSLLDTACSLIGSAGGNCNAISGDGSSGTYGAVSACDPSVKLSFVMSQYYEATNRNAQSCDFSGNATVNANAPSSVSAANSVASSCLASATGTSVPTAPASAGGSSSSGTSGQQGGKSSNTANAATSYVLGDARGLIGVAVSFAVMLGSGFWVLV